ncbi:putative Mitochondrial transcription termination factor family protein [Hibiscus syriacus]|uniref:Mitochondrial transcription termination factor family protein n=1 Tax=Hibiscus syriacus TaxID=106335 RepID=A0A6A2ZU53_HIBSY|nr:uncharacterized protein LOC120138925 [Hibiscus syriacus]KAE8695420.1 putative Mitochondrial transcription termination factor family protein [Hibiscus syriacus]
MKGRDSKPKGTPSADLLVCFPSRSRLPLMPKPICSPARPTEPNNRRHIFIKKPRARNGGGASPIFWAKNKQFGSEITEPTSPKVTCAGQIKVRSKTRSCKSWKSVMEEMQFLTCLRSIRLCFRCFPIPDITTDDEDEDEDGNENQSNGVFKEEKKDKGKTHDDDEAAVPPPNALLLMRCRSAPAKSWLIENVKDGEEECKRKSQKKTKNLRSLMEEENDKIKERLVVVKYDPGFFKTSSDIAKETWVVGGLNDHQVEVGRDDYPAHFYL